MLSENLRRFARAEGRLEQRAKRVSLPHPRRMQLWQPLAELGVFAMLVDIEQGGFGGAPADMAVVIEALAEALLVEPVLASGQMCGRLLQHGRSPLAEELLAKLIAGSATPVLAHVEGNNPFARPTLRAERVATGIRLCGVKPAVRHADVATEFIVTVDLDGDAIALVIPVNISGLVISSIRTIDAAGGGDVRFNDVVVDESALLSFDRSVMDVIGDVLEWGLVGLSVETAALAEIVNDATFAYLNIREQFGVKLASFQALQHKVADMQIAAEEAAAMAAFAVQQLANPIGRHRSIDILRSSIATDRAGRLVAHQGIQLFGGMGVSDEVAVSHHARRLAANRVQIGTLEARHAHLIELEDATL